MLLIDMLRKERQIKHRRSLVWALRVKWYDHEDAHLTAKNKALQFSAYESLRTLYISMPGYKVSQLIEIKKWLSSHKEWRA
jgi:hypothetical protein